jgi:hypothetical protein
VVFVTLIKAVKVADCCREEEVKGIFRVLEEEVDVRILYKFEEDLDPAVGGKFD